MMPRSSIPSLPPPSTPASPTTSTNWTSMTQLKPLRWVLFTHTIQKCCSFLEIRRWIQYVVCMCECVRLCLASKSIHTFIHCFLISNLKSFDSVCVLSVCVRLSQMKSETNMQLMPVVL